MYLDGFKYWLAYTKGTKKYYRCSRKTLKCPGKLIMEDSKIISSIPHDHEKEIRSNIVEKFRKVLTKKAIEKPNKLLVDIYLEETLNHSEASILYPFTQAESTMRKARAKFKNKTQPNEEKTPIENLTKIESEKNLAKSSTLVCFSDKIESTTISFENNLKNVDELTQSDFNEQQIENVQNLGLACDDSLRIDENFEQTSIKNDKENEIENSVDFSVSFESNENSKNLENDLNTIAQEKESEKFQNFNQNSEIISFESQENFSIDERDSQEFLNSSNYQKNEEVQEQSLNFITNSMVNSEQLSDPQEIQLNILENISEKSTVINNFTQVQIHENSLNIEAFNEPLSSFQHPTNSSKVNKSSIDEKKVNNFKFLHHQKYFYHETFDHMTLILMNQATLKTLGQIEEIHVDCEVKIEIDETKKINFDERNENFRNNESFQNLPELVPIQSNSNFYQNSSVNFQQNSTNSNKNFHHLITIIALIKSRDCPIAFGILKNFNPTILTNFFHYLNRKISLNPSTILTSPNEILQFSLKSIYQNANIKIMYFYYAKSTLKMIKNFNEISKNVFYQSSLKMILAMPMIPTNYVVPGFEALRKWMSEKNVDMQELCKHVYDTWLSENAEKISIFNGLAHTINNQTQIFTRELINELKSNESLNLDEIIDKISKQSTKFFIKFSKNNENAMKKVQKLQKTVKFATKSWISSPFHLRRPIQFLQQISHCIDDGIIAFVMNYDENDVKIFQKKKIDEKSLHPPPLVFYGKKNVKINEPPPLALIRK